MKNLVKVISILIISVMVMLFATTVNAADEENLIFKDLTGNTSPNSTPANKTPENNTPANNTPKNNTPANNTPKNNTSVYNNNNTNTNLPKTGIEDSIPVAMLVVVFGVSAVYAYKKISDYRNI